MSKPPGNQHVSNVRVRSTGTESGTVSSRASERVLCIYILYIYWYTHKLRDSVGRPTRNTPQTVTRRKTHQKPISCICLQRSIFNVRRGRRGGGGHYMHICMCVYSKFIMRIMRYIGVYILKSVMSECGCARDANLACAIGTALSS